MINTETEREREREHKKFQFIHRRFYTASDITVKSVCILSRGERCVCARVCVCPECHVERSGGSGPLGRGRVRSQMEWRCVWGRLADEDMGVRGAELISCLVLIFFSFQEAHMDFLQMRLKK